MQFTVFWLHPRHGSGTYQTQAASAEAAGKEAAEALPGDFAEDEVD